MQKSKSKFEHQGSSKRLRPKLYNTTSQMIRSLRSLTLEITETLIIQGWLIKTRSNFEHEGSSKSTIY